MGFGVIAPARVEWREGVAFSAEFGDVYHARGGALAQAQHVFLGGNGLPERWRGRERFTILETGFGLGNNFLSTWSAWRADGRRCARLAYVSVEKHPPAREDLARAHESSGETDLAQELLAAWPPLTAGLHALSFDGGRVDLLLALGDVAQWLPEIAAKVDAFYLDGFAPARNPAMWEARVFKALGRLAAPGATAATWSVARDVRDGLAAAGFEVGRAPGFADKREMTVARFAPRFTPPPLPGDVAPIDGRAALVVGAGLAGASTAWALARQGFACRVVDAASAPAQGASGNAAGLFHGTVHADDGLHARFNRAAALAATRALRPAIEHGGVPGGIEGVLRLERAGTVDAMRDRLAALGLPADFVEALDPPAAAAISGLPLDVPAWHYHGGGWIEPAALVRHWLSDPAIEVHGSVRVQAVRAHAGRWRALDDAGRVCAEADVVVLAAAQDASRLAGDPTWPAASVRGQATRLPPGSMAPPRLPVAGAGYAIALRDGTVWCGATAHAGDDDPTLREADHAYNIERLSRLAGGAAIAAPLDGRVGWRYTARDRMPIVGAVPVANVGRIDRPRLVPRVPGLFVHTALGSRGIAWSVLNAQVLSSAIAGAPLPLERSLLESIDPARFAARAIRKSAS